MTDLRATTSESALLIDATGAVGHVLLQEVLKSKHYARVGEYGRHVNPEANIPEGTRDKLEQRVIDPERLQEAGMSSGNWDVVFVTLGSSEEFEEADSDYVINAAKAARSSDPGRRQRLVYLSSVGADPASSRAESKSRGLTEQALAQLGYSDFIVFRPNYLTGAGFRFRNIFLRPFLGMVTLVTGAMSISVPVLAKSMCLAGELGSKGMRSDDQCEESWDGPSFTAISNAAAIRVTNRVYM